MRAFSPAGNLGALFAAQNIVPGRTIRGVTRNYELSEISCTLILTGRYPSEGRAMLDLVTSQYGSFCPCSHFDRRHGAPSESVHRIFRDREFTHRYSLTEQTRAPIYGVAAPITPWQLPQARGHYTTVEIRPFRASPVKCPFIAPLLADAAGEARRQCFPQTLEFSVCFQDQLVQTFANSRHCDMSPRVECRVEAGRLREMSQGSAARTVHA